MAWRPTTLWAVFPDQENPDWTTLFNALEDHKQGMQCMELFKTHSGCIGKQIMKSDGTVFLTFATKFMACSQDRQESLTGYYVHLNNVTGKASTLALRLFGVNMLVFAAITGAAYKSYARLLPIALPTVTGDNWAAWQKTAKDELSLEISLLA
jgi:hypothetical protein